ncbi:MAG: hypothetical protein QOF14_45 [Hyphomicrobiales bacterium]|jgi:hypothetical protein|nr:hypothetical protein [Hyphomicrobiales bacterium]
MRVGARRTIAIAAILSIALSSLAAAQSQTKRRPTKQEAPPPTTPADKRDRVVNAPGTAFNGKAWWQAAATCGGIYFKLGIVYSDAAIRAKVVKPDPAAYASLTKDADGASKTATAFFDAAERFLIADRKVARDEAVMTYDAVASANGDRVKTADAAVQAAKPCPDLYKTCRGAFPQLCNDTALLTN